MSGRRSVTKLFLIAVALIAGGIGLVWWAWNAPAPQAEPGPGEAVLTAKVLRLADEVVSSSITMDKPHRVSYAYVVDGRSYCADGSVVEPAAAPAAVCDERYIKILRGTYQVLDAMERSEMQLQVIYDSDDPWRSFPVETRESPLRKSLIGVGLAGAGALLLLLGVTRLRARARAG